MKRFGHQEIKDYILGKLSAEQTGELQKALELDPVLKKIYSNYIAKKDLLQYYETLQFTPEESDAAYKRILNSRKKPVWAPGQVWEINDLGRMIILSVNELLQCRGTLLSKSTQFAGAGDIILNDPALAATDLCAYNDHIFTINPEHLASYSGELPTDVVSIFRKTAAGQKVLLPKGYTWGEESDDPEAEIWHEYISEVLNEFTAEALETYENASEFSRVILQLTQKSTRAAASVKPSKPRTDLPDKKSYKISERADLFAEEDMEVYSLPPIREQRLAAASAFNREPEKTLLFKSKEIKVEAALDKFMSGLTLITTITGSDKQIDRLSLNYQGVSFFEEANIPLVRKIARLTISNPEALARFAILPVELVIKTETKTYTIPLEIRKGG